MFCPKCGQLCNDNAAFCPACGADLRESGPVSPSRGNDSFRAPIKQRSIAVCIILTFITCGIYGIYWLVCMVNDLNTAANTTNDTTGGVVFLLSIITCGIYLWVWMYKAGEKVAMIKRRSGGYAESNNGLLYLLLAIFGLSIVSYCLIQSELNNVAAY